MVQKRLQTPVGDTGRLKAQWQYVLARERVRVDELDCVLILGTVYGDGSHLPGHERFEHGRLIRVVERPELLAPDHRSHVVPELWRSVEHVAPPDADPRQRYALGGWKVREKPVQELFIAHHFRPRDWPLDPVRGHAVADGCPAAEPRVLDSAARAARTAATTGSSTTAATTAATTTGAATTQHVGDAFHDAGAGARRPGWRTGCGGGGGRRWWRFVGGPQCQAVNALRQFGASAFHDALAGHGRVALVVRTVVAKR